MPDDKGLEPLPPTLDEVYDDYRRFVNPPLARVMRLSGSPVEWRAQGSIIWDIQGKAYLDFAGGYGVFTLGHRHPKVVEAVRQQLDFMALSGKTMFNALQGRLARRLAEITPGNLEISFFTNSGTEAIEAAIKLARAATKRSRIIATTNAYHGKTIGALSVSGRAVFQEPFGELMPGVEHIPFGDIAALETVIADSAAFILEPIQAEGGVILPPAGYVRAAAELCKKAGALFIADEVQTGLGRCGVMFACDFDGVVPDIMTLAKGLSGGIMPIGACIATSEAWNAAYKHAPLLHTSTFGGNELACAAALAALEVLFEEELVAAAATRGQQLLEGAQRLAKAHPDIIAAVRGAGLLVGVELRHEGYGGSLISDLLKLGITAAWTLNQQRVIRLEPPLVVTEVQVAQALWGLGEALEQTWQRLGTLPLANRST
jgi:putrescine aminotransferase